MRVKGSVRYYFVMTYVPEGWLKNHINEVQKVQAGDFTALDRLLKAYAKDTHDAAIAQAEYELDVKIK